MILKNLKVNGGFVDKTNCYIVEDENTKETMVIDPGGDVDSIIELLDILDAKLKYIYLTHCHGDHIAGTKELKEKKGGNLIHIGELEFRVIHTPGHTKGGSCLYCEEEKLLFSGDTLFKGTWGRTDLPTSDFVSIINSITNKLLVLPDETIVYPGHGQPTRIRDEEPIYYNLMPGEE